MADEHTDDRRSVRIERLDTGVYRATNAAGAEVTFGSLDDAGFSPVELLLAAIGGCSAVDVDLVTGRHAEHDTFEVVVEAAKVRDDAGGNILRDLAMTFRVSFVDGAGADKARDLLPRAVRTSHERTCTVSRTIEAGTPVTVHLEGEGTRTGVGLNPPGRRPRHRS